VSGNAGWGTLVGGANANNDLSLATTHGDTFAFNGTLNLTSVANTGTGSITGIETLSMADVLGGPSNSPDSLTLNSGDVIALGTGTFDPDGSGPLAPHHAVRIDGDSGDSLNFADLGWSHPTATTPPGYVLYVHTTSGTVDAYALVQQAIGVTGGG
jgi:hypothetical protein